MAKKTTSSKPAKKTGATGPAKNVKPKPAKAVIPRKPVAKPAAPVKKAAPPTKAPVKKVPAPKAAPKKAAPAPKVPVKKVPAPKAAPKKAAPAPKVPVKKTPAPKAAPKKVAPPKVVPKKAAPPKAAPKKVAPPKAAPKKPVTQKAPISAKAVRGTPPSVVETEARKLAIQKIQARRNLERPGERTTPHVAAGLETLQPSGIYNGIVVTHEVKPFPSKTPYTKQELEELREALQAKREELLGELASLHGASMDAMVSAKEHAGYSIHIAEHASDLQTAEANIGVRTIEEDRLKEIESALDRIENNPRHYGLCMACGNKIGIQRLKARPHAHLCMPCRTRYETIRSRRGY